MYRSSFFSILVLACFGEYVQSNDETTKDLIIKSIEEKIHNISSFFLAQNSKNADDQEKYLSNLKILFKINSFNDKNKKFEDIVLNALKSNINDKMKTSIISHNKTNNETLKFVNEHNKQYMINGIKKKMKTISKLYKEKVKTEKDKIAFNKNLNKVLQEFAAKTYIKKKTIELFRNIILKGIEYSKNNRQKNINRRMNTFYDIPIKKTNIVNRALNKVTQMTKNTIEDITTTSYQTIKQATAVLDLCSCSCIIEKTCLNIRSIGTLKCQNKSIALNKLCDGIFDCRDGTDEIDCLNQRLSVIIIEKMHRARQIISDIRGNISRNCYTSEISHLYSDKSQKTTLYITLDTQETFMENYMLRYTQNNSLKFKNVTNQTLLNEGLLVLSSVGLILEGAFCSGEFEHLAPEIIRTTDNEILKEDIADMLLDNVFTPKLCKCKKQFCQNRHCGISCERVCWQKFSISQWACSSINNQSSVPLDVICDGKMDCYDESDENGCFTGTAYVKFEANNAYTQIMKLLTSKMASSEYDQVRKLFLSLKDSINKMQKLNMQIKVDVLTVKELRNEIFSLLTSIYDVFINNDTTLNKLNEIYLFLYSLNEKLVQALKLSHTGNERVISLDACFCINDLCGARNCSKRCNRTCAARQKLTRYSCQTSSNNLSITIEEICDGKISCTEGQDEKDCALKEICLPHHLMLLRQSILNAVGMRYQGTAMGEALEAWKSMSLASISTAEKKGRPSHLTLKALIKSILLDLVNTYSLLNDSKKRDDKILQTFQKISLHILKVIKSCGI